MGAAPIVFVCAIAGVVASVGQVGFKPATKALKPDFKKLNPMTGMKNMFSPNSAVEAVKYARQDRRRRRDHRARDFPKLDELAGARRHAARQPAAALCGLILQIAQRAAIAYIAIAASISSGRSTGWRRTSRWTRTRSSRSTSGQELPPEIKGAQRRRGFELARARMMDDVPTADVVVTNPTHYSVALRYDNNNLAPVVVAKGTDQLALRIRRSRRRGRRHRRARPAAGARALLERRRRPDDPRRAL